MKIESSILIVDIISLLPKFTCFAIGRTCINVLRDWSSRYWSWMWLVERLWFFLGGDLPSVLLPIRWSGKYVLMFCYWLIFIHYFMIGRAYLSCDCLIGCDLLWRWCFTNRRNIMSIEVFENDTRSCVSLVSICMIGQLEFD